MPLVQARRSVWAGTARAAGRRWRSYAAVLVFAVAAGVVVATVPQLSGHEGYAGVVLCGVAALVALSLIGLTNPTQDGRFAAQWNAPWNAQWNLHGVRRVRGWYVTDALPFEHDGVDHVVIAPSAVLAVESCYRGSASATGATHERHERDLAAARRAAHKVRMLMRGERSHPTDAVTVEPVLVVWGPGSPDLPTGHRLENGVHVVDGARPERWMHVFAAPRLAAAARRELHAAFELFAAAGTEPSTDALPPLRVQLWGELRAGIAAERAQRTARRTARRSARRSWRHRHAMLPAAGANPGDTAHAMTV